MPIREAFHQSLFHYEDRDWMKEPNPCKSFPAETFFPEHDNRQYNAAIDICSSCRNRLTCLNFALDNHINYGIWGGKGERERKRIARTRRLSA